VVYNAFIFNCALFLSVVKVYNNVTSHAFTPPPSEFGRDVVIISYTTGEISA